MNSVKFKELLLIILVAALFFIIGNMANQFNVYAYIQSKILFPQKNQNSYSYPATLVETTSDPDEISSYSLNDKALIDSEKPLKFFVAGHIYGNPNVKEVYHPATTLLTNVQLMNQFNLDMVVLLGDIVKESTEENFDLFTNNFLDFVQVPVFNAVGNHDVGNRDLYIKKYGETTFSFIYKEHLFIFLDTNLELFSLDENQLNYIQNEIIKEIDEKKVKSIHLFAHHVFFFENSNYSSPSSYYQTNESYSINKKVQEFIQDTLIPFSLQTPVFIYTGDVGAWCGNLSPYYKKYDESNVIAIATGIGNCEDDSVLVVEEINNEITLKVFSLGQKEMMPIDYYNDDYWKSR